MGSAARARARHPIKKNDLFIGYCRPDSVIGLTSDCLTDFCSWDQSPLGRQRLLKRMAAVTGPDLADSRNWVMDTFLESGAKWLLMMDMDMTFDPQTLIYRMLDVAEEEEITILAALCFSGGRDLIPKPVIYIDEQMNRAASYPRDSLIKIAATGAAFMLIHRQAAIDTLNKFKHKRCAWYEYETVGVDKRSEDVTFCLRAREAGHDIYMHTGIEVGHMKMFPLFSEWRDVLLRLPPHELELLQAGFERAMVMRKEI